MFYTAAALAANSNMREHFGHLAAQRDQFNIAMQQMVGMYRQTMTPEDLACNALLPREFWAEVDRDIIRTTEEVYGMDIVTDLMSVQTVLPVGKTAKLYTISGEIAEDVSISIDGQAPYSFDHVEMSGDGDPVPMFSAGYGVNWRLAQGMQTVGIDLVLESQQAKMRRFNEKIVSYMLDGADNVQVQNYPAQGLRNHRNTQRIDLGGGGANIDLVSASFADLVAFFGRGGTLGQLLRTNKVQKLSVLWVSDEIYGNLSKMYVPVAGGSSTQTILQVLMPFIPADSVRPSMALSGNEFLGYVRRRDIVSPLVGMTTGVTPLPRPLPQTNYNFQILAALGIAVKRDEEGRGGVVYGAELT